MKRKFVQIVSLTLAVVLLMSFPSVLAASASAGYSDTDEEYSGVANRIMRIGVYYGDAGKQSIDLTTVTGDGFSFGYYDANNIFIGLNWTDRTQVTVSASSGVITVTDTLTGEPLYQSVEGLLGIEPFSLDGKNTVVKCGYPYYGGFRFELFSGYGDLMTIVNMVELDDYIKGVVPYEMSASWHIEALKAQAVCARTYALAHINSSHQRNFDFDLCDSDDCQVYKGVYSGSQADNINQAVEETAGVVVTYNGSYCDTMYSSSNGGGSESAVNVWGKDYEYLRGKEDPYEATITIPNYNWSVTFTGRELQAKLISAGRTNCGVITQVSAKLSETGNVIALTFIDENGKSWTVYNTEGSGSKCRTLLSLRSLHYTVSSDGVSPEQSNSWNINGSDSLNIQSGVSVINGDGTISTVSSGYVITANGVEQIGGTGSGPDSGASGTVFTFTGTGWGHNVGLSQYGAYAMARLGYTYDQILEFYYTGVMIGA